MTSEGPSSSGPGPVEVVVSEREAGQRVDRILADRSIGWSRSTLQRWIAEGRVTVDGETATRRTRPAGGASIVVRPAPAPPTTAEAQDIPLSVLYEDEHVIVVDKPPGLVVHPAPGHPDQTLLNALLHHTSAPKASPAWSASDAPRGSGAPPGFDQRAGIVHRLDKDTSGIMVAAKTPRAHEGLVELFQAHDIERLYTAIAVGAPPDDATYDTLHGRHPVHRKRFSGRVTRGKRAVTHVRVLERLHGAALVQCQLKTGRTHQIRVHLAEHGTPVLADPTYGRTPRDPVVRRAAEAIGRQALHAGVLGFVHPITGERLRFEVPPPADFQRALALLRTESR